MGSRSLTASDMRSSLSLLTVGLILAIAEALEVTETSLSPAKRLLQALGKQTNGLDTNIDELFYQFLTSKEKSDVSPAEFFSTFYSSLTRESSLVLVTLPAFLLVLASLASLIALPSLLMTRARLSDQELETAEILESVEESPFDEPRYLHLS